MSDGAQRQAAAITAALAARADLAYVAGMRRTVPSAEPAHATRVPDIRKVAVEWSHAHRRASADEVFALFEVLWETGWREERIAAIEILGRSKDAMAAVEWGRIERWSRDIDNWEHVDNLAGAVTSPLLVRRPHLIGEVRRMAGSDHPWQRRLALVTLIYAARRSDWREELAVMSERLKGDKHPLVRKAVVWARRDLAKREAVRASA